MLRDQDRDDVKTPAAGAGWSETGDWILTGPHHQNQAASAWLSVPGLLKARSRIEFQIRDLASGDIRGQTGPGAGILSAWCSHTVVCPHISWCR
ncbi:hypothetical protein ElyMa_005718500 [Elysia marginata]|uniref:Uncharacterized protein n=1 Tax=Elysia marginata TaxID=1093978 RepID=A0AAV4FHP6_9GAST|nr:hypothetical protein ElyMa_005718500 [Elysia marginata]